MESIVTLDDLVEAGALRLAYERLRVSIAMSVGIGFAFVVLLAPFFPWRYLAIWLAALSIVYVVRFLQWRSYARADPSPAETARWKLHFAGGATLAGAVWGFGVATLLPAAGHVESLSLIVILMSVSAAAATAVGAQFLAMVGFLSFSFLPAAAVLIFTGGMVEIMAGFTLAAGFVVMTFTGAQSNHTILQLIRTDLELSRAIKDIAVERCNAEAANRAKSQFLANMSHEVRTPLNGVLGLTELLSNSPLNDSQRRQLNLLKQSGDHLLHVVNEVLDLAKIESGKLEINQQEFELIGLLQHCADIARTAAEEKGLHFHLEMPGNLPQHVIGDAQRIRQILLNLLSNATKFTERGSIRFSARTLGATESKLQLEVRVEDTGIGIAADDQTRIFEAFSQVDEGNTRRFGGTGLGLAVTKRLTDLLSGDIILNSSIGQGSSFCVRLPLQRSTNKTVSLVPESQTSTVTARVLLAEDNPVNREVIVAMLQGTGVEVVCAENGRIATQFALEGSFDLVLMDCQMPVMDGFVATRTIRAQNGRDRSGNRIPVIALTANAYSEDRDRSLEAGMDDFVTKPVGQAELSQVIAHWCLNKQSQPPLSNAR